MDEIIMMIDKRLEFLKVETSDVEAKLLKEAQFNKFWDGKLSSINGINGEVVFLNKLIDKIHEIRKSEPTP